LASAAAQGASMLTMLISVPLMLRYLGAERYGLWLTISSIIAMLSFADLGMGNGLLNLLSEANGKDDRQAAKRYVSSAFFMLLAVTILLGIIWLAIFPLIHWKSVFNVMSPKAIEEAGPALAVFVGFSLLNIPLGIIQRIQMGYQEGFFNSFWQVCGSLLGLGGLFLAISLRGELPWLVVAMMGAPFLMTGVNGFVLFINKRPWLLPKWQAFNIDAAQRVIKTGFLFLVLQVAIALGYQSANVVIAQFLGADQVTTYAVPMKLFMLSPMVVSFILMPLWPAYGEAKARGDLAWVRKTFKRSILLAFAVNIPAAIGLVIFGDRLLHIWAGPDLNPPFNLLLGFGLWTALTSLSSPYAMLLNGFNVVGFQAVISVLMSIIGLTMSIVLTPRLGVAGPIYGTLAAQILCITIPSIFYVKRMFITQSRIPKP
jgi:O-antigen/teichoic acid export membrane protein